MFKKDILLFLCPSGRCEDCNNGYVKCEDCDKVLINVLEAYENEIRNDERNKVLKELNVRLQ